MYQHELFLQTSENMGEICRGLVQTATSAQFDCMTVAVAYATKAGCTLINKSFQSEVPRWREMEKKWLISIDLGITEPDALEFLADLPSSSVWVANAKSVLRARLRPKTRFHNKLYLFECQGNQGAIGVFSGSANLTVSGLYRNNEQATASIWTPPFSSSDKLHSNHIRQQKSILDRTFASGTLLDERLLEQYREIWRPERTSEDKLQLVEVITEPDPLLPRSRAIAMAAASSFWVEVNYVVENLGKNRPGNQIDLQKGSRVFFGFGASRVPKNTLLGTVRIRFGEKVGGCNMRFGNNHMDKLNLPIPGTHGPPTYENQTLLFKRNEDETFDLHIGSTEDIDQWKEASRQQETLFRMRSGREYGVFTQQSNEQAKWERILQ